MLGISGKTKLLFNQAIKFIHVHAHRRISWLFL